MPYISSMGTDCSGQGFSRAKHEEKALYQRVINPACEPAELVKLLDFVSYLNNHITTVPFPCYKQEFIQGTTAGKWQKTASTIEYGDNATTSMLIDGSGYYINDPDNGVQYFVDMKQVSETDK